MRIIKSFQALEWKYQQPLQTIKQPLRYNKACHMKCIYKTLFATVLLFFFLFISEKTVQAIVDPRESANNRFGIHIFDENDLKNAADLVNSSGGDWGYVTLVIREDELDPVRWQRAFDEMRRLHLIPIVRIASLQENSHWRKLEEENIEKWKVFLSSLNWVVKNRYIIVGNEPNQPKEWGGEANPGEYASYLKNFSLTLKENSDDFFILPAGFDASLPDKGSYLSLETFIKEMLVYDPYIFEHVDGIASHSYPNPEFSGSHKDFGKGTVKTFKWELDFLKSLGIEKDFPVFITETGWQQKDNCCPGIGKSQDEISDELKNSYLYAWNDKNIVAVTPFILNYQSPPFNNFSWKKPEGGFYDFYHEIQNIKKTKGAPVQNDDFKIISTIKTPETNKTIYGIALVKNTGQKIWQKEETFFINTERNITVSAFFPSETEPFHKNLMLFVITEN